MPPADESVAPGPNPPFASGKDRRTTQPTLHTARLTPVPLTDEHLELEAELDSDADHPDGSKRSRSSTPCRRTLSRRWFLA
jgi:hypothetical protein